MFHRTSRYMTIAISIMAAAYCSVSCLAVETSVWEVKTAGDFEQGKATDVSIRSDGQVVLSSALELIYDTGELYAWCLAEDAQGNLYIGTGNGGKIFKVSGNHQGSLFFDSPELEILSLAIDTKGNLYAGTAPNGIIYKITPQGQASTFVETGESYIWSLVFNSRGHLFAGTGDSGKILRINPAGESQIVYDSNETHIMTLVLDSSDNLYAGSEGNGIVYRISPDGDVFVLYDAQQKEIHSLTLTRSGILWAGATEAVVYVKQVPVSRESPPPDKSSDDESESEAKPPEPIQIGKEKSVVYEISPDGLVKKLWTSSSLLLSLMKRGDDSLIIGTGDEGRIFSVSADQVALSLATCSESQILSMLQDRRGHIFLGTGNMGKMFRLTPDYTEEGTLESDVYDTGTISKWGRISWEAALSSGTSISLASRSGNSENPDDTWCNWSEAYLDGTGEAITSPPARFIQWRAHLKTSSSSRTPTLKEVSVAYLQHNLPPEISEVTVLPPGKKTGRSPLRAPSKPNEGPSNTKSNSGQRTVEWKASDPNDHQLFCTLSFPGTDEQTWKILTEKEKGTSYSWDTESMPDGLYILKVEASDAGSNPSAISLSIEKESEPFAVDNTPPLVRDLKVHLESNSNHLVAGRAEDATSTITNAEYAIDAGEWTIILPGDDIFDSKTEEFSFVIDKLAPGEHTLVVRAEDEAGNTGAGKIVFLVK